MKVITTKLLLQDDLINMDDLTLLKNLSIFDLRPLPGRPYEKDYNTIMEISIERDLDLHVVSREGYTLLDFFADLGGM